MPPNKRAIALQLTEKGRAATKSATWQEPLLRVARELGADDQAALLRVLTKVIRGLQAKGSIAPMRACVSCRFFRPYADQGREIAHHCDALKSSFGDQGLRLDCGHHETASSEQVNDSWRRFAAGQRP